MDGKIYAEGMVCPTGSITDFTSYSPDLTRWQPKCKCGYDYALHMRYGNHLRIPIKKKYSPFVVEGEPFPSSIPLSYKTCEGYDPIYKELAICPGRGHAAICATCGAWKEWHGSSKAIISKSCNNIQLAGDDDFWNTYSIFKMPEVKYIGGGTICRNYTPFRRKVVKVEMESEWQDYCIKSCRAITPTHEDYIKCRLRYHEEEARAEGFQTWEQLREVLKMYPDGTPLAVIEFERRRI